MAERSLLVRVWDWTPVAPIAGLLIAGAMLGLQLRARAQPVIAQGPTVVLASHGPTALGFEALGQHPGPRAASARHLLVARRGDRWWLTNVSNDRRVLARSSRDDVYYLQQWRLEAGDRITLADATFQVATVDETSLTLRDLDDDRELVWKNGTLTPSNEPRHDVCRSQWSRTIHQLRWRLRDVFGARHRDLPLFSIGGGVTCSSRWKHAHLPPRALVVRWRANAFWLAAGSRRFDLRMARAHGSARALTDLDHPVTRPGTQIEQIILGRTVYRVESDDRQLALLPVANVDLWSANAPIDVPDSRGLHTNRTWAGAGSGAIEWIAAQGLWVLPGTGAAGVLAMALAIYWSRRRYLSGWRTLGRGLGLVPTLVGGWLALLMVRGGPPTPDVMVRIEMMWVAWTWASIVLLFTKRLLGPGGWLWLAALSLVFSGTLSQLQLGAGADNSRWMSFVLKHTTLLTLAGWTIAALATISSQWWRRILARIFGSELPAAGIATLLGTLMIVQLLVGNEEGLAGLQPVELAKTWIVLLLAFVGMHFAEIRQREALVYRRSPLAFLLPFLRFIALFLLVALSLIVGVRDFSPMIIIGLVVLAWLWKVGGRPDELTSRSAWLVLRALVLVTVVAMLAAGARAYDAPEALPGDIPQHDRIMVWARPELHPHSGAQVLNALDRAGEGGWLGATPWFGDNGNVMRVPAVQDDFAATFLLYRFGGIAGLVLLGTQLLYVVALFAIGRRIVRATTDSDFQEHHSGLVTGYLLYGLAWMHISHWVIAWSNTLGLLPVMGQPMTWLSAGNSHLLGFALPTLVVALAAAWAHATHVTRT